MASSKILFLDIEKYRHIESILVKSTELDARSQRLILTEMLESLERVSNNNMQVQKAFFINDLIDLENATIKTRMKLEIVKKHLLLFKKEIEKYENISEANFQYFLLLYFHFYGNNLCPDLWFLFPELNLSRLSSQYLMENWLEQFQIFFLSELELDESSLFWIPNELAKISKVIEKRKTIQNPLKFFFENIKPEHNKLVDSIFCKLAEDNNRFPDLFFVDYN